MVAIFLADGFEEIEALGTLDLLRRAGIDAVTVSVTGNKEITGSHKIKVIADLTEKEADNEYDMVILPGGMPGTIGLENSSFVREMLIKQAKEERYIAAICAAPSILGKMGLLEGKEATCYPGFEKFLPSGKCDKKVVRDGKIITSKGPGTFMLFAEEIIKTLKDKETAEKVLSGGIFN